jgi:hypothetical protein
MFGGLGMRPFVLIAVALGSLGASLRANEGGLTGITLLRFKLIHKIGDVCS